MNKKVNARLIKIMEICNSNNNVTVKELCNILKVSESTIRRDLLYLSDNNMVSRYHGGVRQIDDNNMDEKPLFLKNEINYKTKERLARYVAKKIKDRQMVYIDGGSTTVLVIKYIYAHNITIVTPSVRIAIEAAKKKINTYLLPGFYDENLECTNSNESITRIKEMQFNLCILGTTGISEFYQFSTNSELTSQIKAAAIQQSEEKYILADSSKYSVMCISTFAHFNEVILITDAEPPKNYTGIETIVVPEDYFNFSKSKNQELIN